MLALQRDSAYWGRPANRPVFHAFSLSSVTEVTTIGDRLWTPPLVDFSVSHDPISEPGISIDRIFISCGHIIRTDGTLAIERSVTISVVNGSDGKRTLGVGESIGESTALH